MRVFVRSLGSPGRTWVSAFVLGLAVVLASCATSTSTMNPATAKTQIGHAYSTLFNFSNKNVSAKVSLIQNGSSVERALSEALSSSLAKSATGARVDAVQLLGASDCSQDALPAPCARVTYDLLGAGGAPLFTTPSSGYAVYLGGRWLVAKSTICSLLGLFYSASGRSGSPPGC